MKPVVLNELDRLSIDLMGLIEWDEIEHYDDMYLSGVEVNINYDKTAENLLKHDIGNKKQAQIAILKRLMQIIHEDDFEQLCQDGAASEGDVSNYINNLIEEIRGDE